MPLETHPLTGIRVNFMDSDIKTWIDFTVNGMKWNILNTWCSLGSCCEVCLETFRWSANKFVVLLIGITLLKSSKAYLSCTSADNSKTGEQKKRKGAQVPFFCSILCKTKKSETLETPTNERRLHYRHNSYATHLLTAILPSRTFFEITKRERKNNSEKNDRNPPKTNRIEQPTSLSWNRVSNRAAVKIWSVFYHV